MKRICRNPISWNEVFQQLTRHARSNSCMPKSPPKPLILAGWAYSSDEEKAERWEEIIAWATSNGCAEIINRIKNEDFYCL